MACSVSKIEGPISKDIEAAINKIEQEGTRATYDRIKEETESIIGSEVLDGMQIGVRIWNKSPCTLRVFSSQGGTKKKDYGSFGPDMNVTPAPQRCRPPPSPAKASLAQAKFCCRLQYGCMTRVGASFIVEVDGVTLPELHTNRWKSQHFFVESSPEPLSSPVTKEVAEVRNPAKLATCNRVAKSSQSLVDDGGARLTLLIQVGASTLHQAAQVYKMLEKVRTHVDATEYKLANRWLQQCRDTLTKPKAVTNLQKLLGAEGFADATKALVEYFDQLEQRIKPHLAFVVPSTTYTARGSSASYGAPVSSFYNRGVSTSYSYAGGGSSISSSYYSTGSAWNAKSSTGFVGLSNQVCSAAVPYRLHIPLWHASFLHITPRHVRATGCDLLHEQPAPEPLPHPRASIRSLPVAVHPGARSTARGVHPLPATETFRQCLFSPFLCQRGGAEQGGAAGGSCPFMLGCRKIVPLSFSC
eukprot:SAG11_NODE_305_length_10996_cov_4.698082_3_plen_471_part_00